MSDALLTVEDLRVHARLGRGDRTIVGGVSLELGAGETLAIVGESGSGKSLTARSIVGLLPRGVHASGSVRYRGRELLGRPERELAAVRGRELAPIMQDPFTMLNPLMRCGEQIVELLRDERGGRLGRRARRAEAARRLAEVGIDDAAVADAYPFELSGGMRQRVAIAAALARDPEVLIADEPSTALDVTTQQQILRGIRRLQESRGMGLILITHDLRLAFSTCDRVMVLYAGAVVEEGRTAVIGDQPRHPYTHGLLLSEPRADRRQAELIALRGSVPGAEEVLASCPFAPRCRWSRPECVAGRPPLLELESGHHSACIREPEIASEMTAERTRALIPRQDGAGAMPGAPVLTVRGLRKAFGDRRRGRPVVALGGVSIEVGPGESVGLVGESGSGKSTLGRCLVGLEQPDAGAMNVDGLEFAGYRSLDRRGRARLHRSIQMVFQDPYSTLNPVRTVGATLAEALRVRDPRMADVPARVDELLERVGVARGKAKHKPVALSGGERQRIAIARALAMEPRIIVCDEPVSALDVSVQAQVLNLLDALRRESGVSYLFITHDLAVVRQIADRVYVLRRGELLEDGAVDDVLDRPRHPYTRALIEAVPGPGVATGA